MLCNNTDIKIKKSSIHKHNPFFTTKNHLNTVISDKWTMNKIVTVKIFALRIRSKKFPLSKKNKANKNWQHRPAPVSIPNQ